MFSQSVNGQILILTCDCDVTADNFLDFKLRYNKFCAMAPEDKSLILDLSAVNHLVSSAIGVIAASYPELKKRHVSFRIVASSVELLRLLKVTRLSKVVRTNDSLKSAVAALE